MRLQKGAGRLTTIVFGAITFVLLYCAYHILPFYYYYYELQNQFEAHAKAADVYTNTELRNKLMYHIKKTGVPIRSPEDLRIDRTGNGVTISLAYSELFYVGFGDKYYDIYRFHFNPRASTPGK